MSEQETERETLARFFADEIYDRRFDATDYEDADQLLSSEWLARHDDEVAAKAKADLIAFLIEETDDIEGTHFKEPADFWMHTRGQVCAWLEQYAGGTEVEAACPYGAGAHTELIRQAKAEALREAARELFNGAGDPEQALYDYGGARWLTDRADRIEAS